MLAETKLRMSRRAWSGGTGKHGGPQTGTVQVKDINAGGGFNVLGKGTADTTSGTLRLRVSVEAAGQLEVAPVGGSRLRSSSQNAQSAGLISVTLRPTKAGMRVLKRDGRLVVRARFTFTPCGGTGTSLTRNYTLRLR